MFGTYPSELHAFFTKPMLGMGILHKINPKVHRAVADAALPLKKIRSRAKPWFDKDVPFDTLLELDIEEAIRSVGGETEEKLIIDGEVMCYSIMRGALQVSYEKRIDPFPYYLHEFL